MRKIVVSEFVSLDTVMQAPGGAEEDTEGGSSPTAGGQGRSGTMTLARTSLRK